MSSLSISPCHDQEYTLSTAYTEYSIHRGQQTPSTAYTVYSIHRVLACTANYIIPTSTISRSQPASPLSVDQVVFNSLHFHNDELTNDYCLSSRCASLQVLLQSRSIMASTCISKLASSLPPSASPKSLDHGLQVHLQTP
jgi:hypothetical protein